MSANHRSTRDDVHPIKSKYLSLKIPSETWLNRSTTPNFEAIRSPPSTIKAELKPQIAQLVSRHPNNKSELISACGKVNSVVWVIQLEYSPDT